MNLTHLIFFEFFVGAGSTTASAPTGPWFVAAVGSFSAGAVVADAF